MNLYLRRGRVSFSKNQQDRINIMVYYELTRGPRDVQEVRKRRRSRSSHQG